MGQAGSSGAMKSRNFDVDYWKGASPEVVKLGEEERGLKTRRWVVFPSVVLVRSLACGFLSLTL